MKERSNQIIDFTQKRLLDANEVCVYLSLGRTKGIEFAKSIGAEIRIGRRCLYDKVIIDNYFNLKLECFK